MKKLVVVVLALSGALVPSGAGAQESCRRAVVLTLPGVTWTDLTRAAAPHMRAVADAGAVGSMAVRTVVSPSTVASGFATLGAGSRVEAPPVLAPPTLSGNAPTPSALVPGVPELKALADEAGYGARPGALGTALGEIELAAIGNGDPGVDVPVPAGVGRWTLLAAMNESGVVDISATENDLLEADASAPYGVRTDPTRMREVTGGLLGADDCRAAIIDQGDLTRVERSPLVGAERSAARSRALGATDEFVAFLRALLDPRRDLLTIVTPVSPVGDDDQHLGIAIVRGPGFPAGRALRSATTGRTGLVTLPDVAPTVLAHLGVERPSSMSGRAMVSEPVDAGDRAEAAAALDEETVAMDDLRPMTVWSFVGVQALVFAGAILLARRRSGAALHHSIVGEGVLLAIAAFPLAAYLAGAVSIAELGASAYSALLAAIDFGLVAALLRFVASGRDRFLMVAGLTVAVLVVDLLSGARLQLNTILGYSPVIAGRFNGLGNLSFGVFGAATVLTGALVAHRWRGSPVALGGVGCLFFIATIAIGAPGFGSDFGGVIAFVPASIVTFVLLTGRKLRLGILMVAGGVALAVVTLFLVYDLSRPVEEQTHLARLFEDVRGRGGSTLTQTVERKARANLRILTTSTWSLVLPFGVAALVEPVTWLRKRWQTDNAAHPLRAAFVGGLLMGTVAMLVNDSGVAIPAIMLSSFVPAALLARRTSAFDEDSV